MQVLTLPLLAAAISSLFCAMAAQAACPIERATYADMEGVARLEFKKTDGAATVTNRFSMLLDNNVVLDGIVQWSDRVPRPNGQLGYKCPVGDATGEELARCTVWQGVIYTADEMGNVELLPAEGVEAPKKLIFPDLGYSLRMSSAYGANGFSQTPWDVFEQRGCQ